MDENTPKQPLTAVYVQRICTDPSGGANGAKSTAGPDRFGLVTLCQRYVDEQWLADHATPEQAAEMLREQFRRAVLAEIELLEVKCAEASG